MSELDRIEKKIVSDMEELQHDLETIKKLKKKYNIENEQLAIIPEQENTHQVNGDARGVIETVISTMIQFPNKHWTPKLLEKELAKQRSAGKLISEAKSLRIAAHTALSSLVRQDKIIKHGGKRIPTYTVK